MAAGEQYLPRVGGGGSGTGLYGDIEAYVNHTSTWEITAFNSFSDYEVVVPASCVASITGRTLTVTVPADYINEVLPITIRKDGVPTTFQPVINKGAIVTPVITYPVAGSDNIAANPIIKANAFVGVPAGRIKHTESQFQISEVADFSTLYGDSGKVAATESWDTTGKITPMVPGNTYYLRCKYFGRLNGEEIESNWSIITQFSIFTLGEFTWSKVFEGTLPAAPATAARMGTGHILIAKKRNIASGWQTEYVDFWVYTSNGVLDADVRLRANADGSQPIVDGRMDLQMINNDGVVDVICSCLQQATGNNSGYVTLLHGRYDTGTREMTTKSFKSGPDWQNEDEITINRIHPLHNQIPTLPASGFISTLVTVNRPASATAYAIDGETSAKVDIDDWNANWSEMSNKSAYWSVLSTTSESMLVLDENTSKITVRGVFGNKEAVDNVWTTDSTPIGTLTPRSKVTSIGPGLGVFDIQAGIEPHYASMTDDVTRKYAWTKITVTNPTAINGGKGATAYSYNYNYQYNRMTYLFVRPDGVTEIWELNRVSK